MASRLWSMVEAGTEAEAVQECVLWDCFSWLAQLPCIAQAHPPGGGTTYSVPGPTTSISNQENAPQTCPKANLVETIPQLSFSLLKCITLTIKTNQHSVCRPVSGLFEIFLYIND